MKMIEHSLRPLGHLLTAGAVMFLAASTATISAAEPARHLFILSGQSNMTGALKSGFAEKVEAHFGKENVAIAHQCKPSRGIRFWDVTTQVPLWPENG